MAAVRRWVLLACLVGLASTGNAAAADLAGETLVKALRAGGLTIYFRHTETDWSKDDHIAKAGDWTNCDPNKMRQLSAKGRETAKAIGRALNALKVPVRKVYSSGYCRTTETVALMQIGPVQATTDIMNLRAADHVGGRDAAIGRLRKLLATPVAHGANVVIGAHGNLIKAASGVYPGEGGAVVFRADAPAPHGFRHLASIEPAEWPDLARRFAAKD
ncbi:MAG: histidine phosphatase family protein [Rhodospirillaceae bacterium]